MKRFYNALIAMLLLISLVVCGNVSLLAVAKEAASADASSVSTDKNYEFDGVLYKEDFSGDTFSFSDGNNTTKNAGNWIYKKGTSASKGTASIKDGRLYFSGDRYDYLYLSVGESWKNYTLEADFCYTTDNASSGWAGLMYNVIELSGGGIMAQKGGTLLPADGRAILNGTKKLKDGGSTWANDAAQNKVYMKTALDLTVPDKNQPFRIKITTYENTATLYYAFLNDDATMKTPYTKIMSIDNIPENARYGSIGLMSSGNGNFASCWIDNIKCQELIYEESFDNVTSRVDIALGTNTTGAAEGWIYNKHNGGDGVAYIENGRLYMSGGNNAYDVLYRADGLKWSNYTLEADFCYTDANSASGWGGMMYNVQSPTKFQKGAITTGGAATLNGYSGNWSNNNTEDSAEPTKNHTTLSGKYEVPKNGTPFRMKICVFDKTAAFYYAIINSDGSLKTPFLHVLTIDNIASDACGGSIGFMTSAWGNYASFWIDNIRCYESRFTNYAEDFDNVTDKVVIQQGNNIFGAASGWIFNKKADNAEAYIENGRLYFSGSKYDVIYRDGGEVWGNYTLEADFCYTDANTSWGGILYNVQDSGNKFQKAGITAGGGATLNGNEGGVWTNNNFENSGAATKNHYTMPSGSAPGNAPFRMKVTVYNKTATLYYAMLDEYGNMKTPYIYVMSIDNIPADNQTGSIGLMSSGNNQYASFWVDNIKCYTESPVSYTESFDSYTNYEISSNAIDKTVGLNFHQNSTAADDSRAEVKDGALYLYGGTTGYDALFFTTGDNWTNYSLETDFTYLDATAEGLNNDGWAGILFRSTDINNFYKGMLEVSKDGISEGVLNGKLNNSWHMDDRSANRANYNGTIAVGSTYRIRIVATENTASLYVAQYTNGTLGEWTRVVTITDRFAPIHMKGTIGLIVGGGVDSRYRAIKIDNITVSQIPGTDRFYEEPNAANIYEAESGIVNPPVVVEMLKNTLPATSGERAAVVITEIDENLNVLGDGGEVLTTAEEFISTYRRVLIPAFKVDSVEEADALASLLYREELTDAYVVADERNAALVRRVRMANDITNMISGAIIFENLNSPTAMRSARATVSDNMSYVAISKAPLSEDAAFYFAQRQIAAWSFAQSTAEVYRAVANGYHGIISSDVSVIYDVYESITEPTVSGRTVVIAHRGANDGADIDYPENTLMGIRAAKEIWGANAVEIDFGLTKDGYVVIMHDDTVDRTTNGTGKVSSLTLEEIKALKVDYVAGKETTVPTLEEVLLLAKELDIVLYCHVKDVTDANIAAFTHLVNKHDCYDNVLLFAAPTNSYNSNTDRVYSGTPYNLNNSPVVPEGIVFTAGDMSILKGVTTHIEGVIKMKNALNKYNYQPLFYPYLNQGSLWSAETFYYQLSARGFVNTHSITDGQARMDNLALTQSGCVGWLTNNLHLADDYHYEIDISGDATTLKFGEALTFSKTVNLIKGTAIVDCGLVQLDGKTLEAVEGGYTLREAGVVTVVYYATRTTDGGTTYRVYSEPVTVAFVSDEVDSFTPKSSITLGSELVYNVYVPVTDELKSFTVNGKSYENLTPVTLDDGKSYYRIEVPMAAAEAAEDIILSVTLTADGEDFTGTYTMSIAKYAKKSIANSTSTEEVTLVKDVLAYIRAAYVYFGSENAEAVCDEIDSILAGYTSSFSKVAGDTNANAGLKGVITVLEAKPAVRFVLPKGVSADGYTFSQDERVLNYKTGIYTEDGVNYVYCEVELYAYQMIGEIEYTDGTDSGKYHLNSYYDFVTTDDKHKDNESLIAVVEKLYNYCKSAESYRASVTK